MLPLDKMVEVCFKEKQRELHAEVVEISSAWEFLKDWEHILTNFITDVVIIVLFCN